MEFIKRLLIRVGVSLLVIALIAGLYFAVKSIIGVFPKEEASKSVSISEDMCKSLFECTPHEFVAGNYFALDQLEDMIMESRVDNRGWLVIIVTAKQARMLSESDFFNTFPELTGIDEIVLSTDKSTLTVFVDSYSSLNDLSPTIAKVLHKLCMCRFFSGVRNIDNFTTVIIKDKATGKVLSSENYYGF